MGLGGNSDTTHYARFLCLLKNVTARAFSNVAAIVATSTQARTGWAG